MISLLYLQNFQSHKETKVEFSPGVNVIVGLSRRGKTSLLRAIKWVAENRPAGDEFRSHWPKKGITAVSMKLTPGGLVERHKANGAQ